MASPEDVLRERIRATGPVTFATFMEEALYGPEGYYSATRLQIGEDGDFVTGSSFSPLFARSTATVVRRLSGQLGGGADYLEAGYGNGDHLLEVARSLGADSGHRVWGWDRVSRPLVIDDGSAAVERLESLETIAAAQVNGVVFSYELFDALPFHRLIGREGGVVGELWVELDRQGEFCWREDGLSDPDLVDLLGGSLLEVGQIADLSPGWVPLYERLVNRLGRGILVTCDYGFLRRRLFDRRVRFSGTLACYSEQRVHRNPFVRIGRQDLTAHLDFSSLMEAGERLGLTTLGLSRQALWLASTGLFAQLEGADATVREQAMRLLDGDGMGEEIRVLVQARGVSAEAFTEPGSPPLETPSLA